MEEHVFTNPDVPSSQNQQFQGFYERGERLDVVLETKEKKKLSAHAVVLAAQFPGMRKILLKQGAKHLRLTRFPACIVEVAVNYAYRGEVKVTTAIAPHLYLLSLNLQDRWLERMCIEFLTSRMEAFDLRGIWAIANVTLDKKLVKACGSQLGAHFAKMEQPDGLFEQTTVAGMRALLQLNKFNQALAPETKLRILRSWLLALNSHAPRKARESVFDEMISYIRLSGISSETVLQIARDLPPAILKKLVDLRRKAAKTEEGKCIPQPSRPGSFFQSSSVEDLFAYGHTNGVISSVKTDDPQQLMKSPLLRAAPVAFGDDIYLIGGTKSGYFPSNEVEKWNTKTLECTEMPNMVLGRVEHSAAVDDRGRILVSGGCEYSSGKLYPLSGCEMLAPNAYRWTLCGGMSSMRLQHASLYVPEVGFLMLGGVDENNRALDTVDILEDSASLYSRTTPAPPMLTAKSICCATLISNRVFAIDAWSPQRLEVLSFSAGKPGQWTHISFHIPKGVWIFDRIQSLFTFNGGLMASDRNGSFFMFIQTSHEDEETIEDYTLAKCNLRAACTRPIGMIITKRQAAFCETS